MFSRKRQQRRFNLFELQLCLLKPILKTHAKLNFEEYFNNILSKVNKIIGLLLKRRKRV